MTLGLFRRLNGHLEAFPETRWTQTEPSTSRDRFTGPHDEYPMLETVVKPKVKVVQVCDVPSDAGLKKGPWAEHDPEAIRKALLG